MSTPTYISIKEMFAYINSGKPFSIVYVTCDKQKGTAGTVKQVQLATKHYSKEASNPIQHSDAKAISSQIPKNPNHFFNSTFNIRIPASGPSQIRKVHAQLIRVFNGAIVK